MPEYSTASVKVTYGQLEQALQSLGFVRLKSEEFKAYREVEHDALIVLPAMSADTLVGDPHLLAVRNTIVGKGITTWEQLHALLLATQRSVTPSSHATTNAPANGASPKMKNRLKFERTQAIKRRMAVQNQKLT